MHATYRHTNPYRKMSTLCGNLMRTNNDSWFNVLIFHDLVLHVLCVRNKLHFIHSHECVKAFRKSKWKSYTQTYTAHWTEERNRTLHIQFRFRFRFHFRNKMDHKANMFIEIVRSWYDGTRKQVFIQYIKRKIKRNETKRNVLHCNEVRARAWARARVRREQPWKSKWHTEYNYMYIEIIKSHGSCEFAFISLHNEEHCQLQNKHK